jgi:hypothetical protein
MKQYIVLIFILMCSYTVYSQSYYKEGDKCFEEGDYTCAETKYKELYKSASEADMQFGEIKIQRAKLCKDNLKIADQAFASLNYTKAKEKYQSILDSSPKDFYAKSQIEKCNTKINEAAITTLQLSKTDLFFLSSGGSDNITINSNSYSIEMLPSWCTVQKYDSYFIVYCDANYSSTTKTDFFYVTARNKTIRINVKQQGSTQGNENTNQTISPSPKPVSPRKKNKKLPRFSSLGFQSGEIAKYGFLYERGGKRAIGFHLSARTSLTPEEDILNGTTIENKTEIDLGPSLKIFNRLYLNIGVGYGYYNRVIRNDYANAVDLEETGYLLASSGLMMRISRVININAGVSFIDIDKAFYNPEITFGLSFNLKKR